MNLQATGLLSQGVVWSGVLLLWWWPLLLPVSDLKLSVFH